MPTDPEYAARALLAIEATAIPGVLARRSTETFVLECVASGGGATNWYRVRDSADLADLSTKLRPGSLVSFYFDGRIAQGYFDSGVAKAVAAIAARDHGAVIGELRDEAMGFDVQYVAGEREIADFADELPPGAKVAYGPFPASDNDGEHAVTLVLPDLDGVVRRHPY
jgi:hypothetical protein